MSFWSDAGTVCSVPTCTTALIAVLGSTYIATDTTINYTYDDLNRLTAADYSNGMYYHYEYDSVGNRLQQVSAFLADPVTTSYAYDDANRLTTVGGQTYSFDANGNLLSDGTYTYSYDTANRLVGVATAATAVTYRYNGLGNRLQQSSNGVDTNYTLELNSGLSQVLADGTNTYLYGMNRIGMSNTTGNYLYEYDALGSVRQMENIAGLTLAESYDPYGNVILSSGQAGIYGYSGEEQSSNGLVYLRARFLSSATGTFLSRDTWNGDANLPMSYNRWMYTYGNPVNYTDPSGNQIYRYDRKAASDYAVRWATSNNFAEYGFMSGFGTTDCTNFVSQSLKAGGMPEDKTWFFELPGIPSTCSKYPFSPKCGKAWAAAPELYNYLTKDKKFTTTVIVGKDFDGGFIPQSPESIPSVLLTNVREGDVVFLTQDKGANQVNHAAFLIGWGKITDVQNNQVFNNLPDTPLVVDHSAALSPYGPHSITDTKGKVYKLEIIHIPDLIESEPEPYDNVWGCA